MKLYVFLSSCILTEEVFRYLMPRVFCQFDIQRSKFRGNVKMTQTFLYIYTKYHKERQITHKDQRAAYIIGNSLIIEQASAKSHVLIGDFRPALQLHILAFWRNKDICYIYNHFSCEKQRR